MTFPVKGQTVNIPGSVDQMVCVTTTVLPQEQKPAPDKTRRKESGRVPIKLYFGTEMSISQAFHVAQISFFWLFFFSPII